VHLFAAQRYKFLTIYSKKTCIFLREIHLKTVQQPHGVEQALNRQPVINIQMITAVIVLFIKNLYFGFVVAHITYLFYSNTEKFNEYFFYSMHFGISWHFEDVPCR
jgi:hypothetical protein